MRIRHFAAVAASLLMLVGCNGSKERPLESYMDFMYRYMPLPDSTQYSRDYWEANVKKAIEVRSKAAWIIPEREFRHFVLPVRVNNETLDDFRLIYADSLCERVKGMSLAEAAIEVNHWCHERLTYRPSDGRTSSPLASIRYSYGRCGEESVLAVAALRAAGIPARQVYTPRWAHTDDNHAWVEVWVDGKWYFMGACEPEPSLNMAWFNAPVSRALLLHTKAYGNYEGKEDIISSTACFNEINTIREYVPARRTAVTVKDENGAPVEGATVEYTIYNYAEFYPVARYLSDAQGKVGLDTGLGDMLIWAEKDGRFGIAVAGSEQTDVVLEHKIGDRLSLDFDIVPPAEDPIPASATEEEIAANAARLEQENDIRERRHVGNEAVIDAFLTAHPDDNAKALVASLSLKDLNDVTSDVLEDAYTHCKGNFEPYRDSPRIELEFLRPFFAEMSDGTSFSSPEEVAAWVMENISINDERNPQRLRTSPVAVWRSRISDSLSRDIFYVALCRANGFSARINEITGQVQYLDNGTWHNVLFGAEDTSSIVEKTGSIRCSYVQGNSPHKDPMYYQHFTISRFDSGRWNLLTFGDDTERTPVSRIFPLRTGVGYYSITSGTRMADGSVLAHMEFFNVEEDKSTDVTMQMRTSDEKLAVLGSFDADPLLPLTGRGYYGVAILGDYDEPSNHARRDLEAIDSDIKEWGRPFLTFRQAEDNGLAEALRSACKATQTIMPVVVVADSFGRIVYFSQGYNTSLGEDLKRVIHQL